MTIPASRLALVDYRVDRAEVSPTRMNEPTVAAVNINDMKLHFMPELGTRPKHRASRPPQQRRWTGGKRIQQSPCTEDQRETWHLSASAD
jgi:hypothetical protein